MCKNRRIREQRNYRGLIALIFQYMGEGMNLFNDLILMVAGFDLFVMYLIYKAVSFYRNN